MTTEVSTNMMERAITGEVPEIVNRCEMTGELLAHISRVARRSLRYPWGEDFTGEFVCRLLDEAHSVGRPNMVRKDHVQTAWIKLEARSYALRVANPTDDEVTGELESDEDSDEDTGGFTRKWRNRPTVPGPEDMESTDVEDEDEDGPEYRPVKLRQAAGRIVRLAHLHDEPKTVYPVFQALAKDTFTGTGEKVTPAAMAATFDMSLANWQQLVSRGAKFMRDSYPTPGELADSLMRAARGDSPRHVARRDTPLAARKLGKPLPKDSHRTPAQTYREADWLLATPAPYTGKPHGLKVTGESRTGDTGNPANVAPVYEAGELRPASFDELASLYTFPAAPDDSPRRGRRPGNFGDARLPHGDCPPELYGGGTVKTPPARPEGLEMAARPGGHRRYWHRSPDTGELVPGELHPSPAWLALHRYGRGEALPVWTPAATGRTSRCKLLSGPASLTGTVPAEDTGRKLTRAELRHIMRVAPAHRRTVLTRLIAPVSDVATGDEHRKESDEAFPMVEDMIRASAE